MQIPRMLLATFLAGTSPTLLQAQARLLERLEVSVAAGLGAQQATRMSTVRSADRAIGVSVVPGRSGWGAELSLDVGGERLVAQRAYRDFGVPISIVRRIGKQSREVSTSGLFVKIGYNSRFIALGADTTGASSGGPLVGMTFRYALGRYVVLRQDYVMLVDRGAQIEQQKIHGITRHSFRLGAGFLLPIGK